MAACLRPAEALNALAGLSQFRSLDSFSEFCRRVLHAKLKLNHNRISAEPVYARQNRTRVDRFTDEAS